MNSVDASPTRLLHHRYVLGVSRENRRALRSTACCARLGTTTWTGLLHDLCSGFSYPESASSAGCHASRGRLVLALDIPFLNGKLQEDLHTQASSRFQENRRNNQPTACDEATQELIRTSANLPASATAPSTRTCRLWVLSLQLQTPAFTQREVEQLHHADAICRSVHHWTI